MIAGSCHCGAHRFTAPAPAGVTRCNCSICTKRGVVCAYYAPDEVSLDIRPETLIAYQWGDRMMTFHTCAVCGCAVFDDAPEWVDGTGAVHPGRVILNARLFDDFDLDAVPVRRVDGRSRP